MQLSGYDYLRDKLMSQRGLAHLAPKIEALRNEGIASLLFDNGDFLQGNALADTVMADVESGQAHPMIAAMNRLKYDAITLGNHEFDYGLADLKAAIKDCDMPVVSANVRVSPTEYLIEPWTLLDRQVPCSDGETRSLKIGVIGFVTPQICDWNHHLLSGAIVTDDIINAAKTHLGAMRRAGADIVVALCHAGIGAMTHTPGMENAAAPLAGLLGVDVVLAGHTHDFFPGEMFPPSPVIDPKEAMVYGKPLVMAGYDGLALGIVDLDLTFDDNSWRITAQKASLTHARDIPAQVDHPDSAAILASIQAPHLRTRAKLNRALAHSDQPLSSHFTMVGQDPSIQLVAWSQMNHARKMLNDEDLTNLPIIGSASSFRSGGHGGAENFINVPTGPIVLRDVGAMAPFNNPICAVLRRGWQVRRWLEFSASYFLRINAGMGAQPLVSPRFPSYHFDWLVGLNYAFDLTVPARFDETGTLQDHQASRVRNLMFRGKPVQDDDLFIVVTSVYRAHGGGLQGPIEQQDVLWTSALGATDILADAITNASTVRVPDETNWGFTAIEGARGVFRTSPAAQHGPVPPGVERLADTADGFDAYAITF